MSGKIHKVGGKLLKTGGKLRRCCCVVPECCFAAEGDDLPIALQPPRPDAQVSVRIDMEVRRAGGPTYPLDVDEIRFMDLGPFTRPPRCSARSNKIYNLGGSPEVEWTTEAAFDAISIGSGAFPGNPGMSAHFVGGDGFDSVGGFGFIYHANVPNLEFVWPDGFGGELNGTITPGSSTLDEPVEGIPTRFRFQNWLHEYNWSAADHELEIFDFMVQYLDLRRCGDE